MERKRRNCCGVSVQDFIIGGDFNAGCSYVRPADWSSISLKNDPRFLWTIGDNVITSVSPNCPYDRSSHLLIDIN